MQKFHLGLSQIPHSPSMEEEHSSSSMSILSTPFLETPRKTPSKPNKRTIVTTLMEAATFTSSSFKEDTYFISNLKSSEKKALKQLKEKLLASDEITNNGSMWGVCLIKGDDVADVLLLKFLRARDFRVNDAYTMLVKCLSWRKEFGAENVVDEDLGFKELEGVVAFTHGFDREGHPVCYNHYGVFKDKEMYERDMPKSELRVVSNQIMSLFQDNYPEMVARKIFINVPWYFSMLYSMFSPFLTQRTKSKFVISKEGNAAETLYKFIRPENIPIQYGGLSRPSDFQNGPPKLASEFTVKGGEKVNIQIEGVESGATIKWEIVVGGWDLEYSAEFVPNAEASYTIEVEKARKVNASEEAIQNSYTSKEAGIMVLSVDNSASRKKKVAAYRYFVRKYNSNTPSDMQLSLKIK
ncbi:putative CRAL-TRIO lipid binding domain, GOLD domain, CRAL/TRIO domain-containing protein [Medicago truncatula]|uniref:Putative CRAL-TRIO lipid binding domain, GOLD domain, CRAL/TRIO domain-containing protein n=1 Tax=Medicago truncatula TaxID=3880 RepID=A0A396GZM4_MEDTR|nr:putative CRAL-TRIO lipid binding domain, GOLD domain, CRAL/TRIO domain-containing protein [Medicago truncatula]